MIRVKLSEHSNWPTIPQLFVKGELIGGADITKNFMRMDLFRYLIHPNN